MSKAAIGATVSYCGHNASFPADIFRVGSVNVVRINGPLTEKLITRPASPECTHHLADFPEAGFWRPDIGVFVVPQEQVTAISKRKKRRKLNLS